MKTFAYGYRASEINPITIFPIKDGTRLIKFDNGKSERAVVAASAGPHFRGALCPRPDYNDGTSMLAGITKRFLSKPPNKERHIIRGLRRFTKRWIKKNLKPLSTDTDVSFETWLARLNATASRKLGLKRLKDKDISIFSDMRNFHNKSFMKDESYREYKYPRAINSRSDEFKIYSGPIFKCIEDIVYRHPAFIKHVPVSERPAYIKRMLYRVGSSYIETDYTSFEALFTKEIMLAVEMQLYEYMTSEIEGGKEWYNVIRRDRKSVV